MSDEDLLKAFKRWQDSAGRSKTISCLTARDVSPRTADVIATGDYGSRRPKRKLRAAMLDILKTEKAS